MAAFCIVVSLGWGQDKPDSDKKVLTRVKPVTVCEVFADLRGFNGKVVAVIGKRVAATMSSWTITEDDCGKEQPVRIGKKWPFRLDLGSAFLLANTSEDSPKTISVDDAVFAQKFAQIHKTTKLDAYSSPRECGQINDCFYQGDRWAMAYGKIETDRPPYGELDASPEGFAGSLGRIVVIAPWLIVLNEDGSQDLGKPQK